MGNWIEIKLKDICTIKGGKRLPKGHTLTETLTEHPYIKGRDIKKGKINNQNLEYLLDSTFNKISRYIVNTNDICITIVANIGDVGIVTNELDGANLTENAVKLRVFDKRVNPYFLLYLLSSKYYKEYMELLASGAAQSKLGIYKIENISIKVPSLFEQQQIAEILSAYDDLIETNNQRIATLEQLAQQIYKEWFVRMRFPGWEQTHFHHGVPDGWEVKKLGEIIKLEYGKSLTSESRIEGDVPVYGSSGVIGMHNKALVKPPGIIVGRKGNVGAIHFVNKPFYPIDTVFFVYPLIKNWHFLFFLLKNQNFINSDAAVPGLNRNQAYATQLFLPTQELILKFEKQMSSIFEQIEVLTKQNQNLTKTRNLLLPRLISGKLSIKQAESQTP